VSAGGGEGAQLRAAPLLERRELAGLGVQPGALHDLGRLAGVELDQLEVAVAVLHLMAVVGRQHAHRLAGQGQHRHAVDRAHAVGERGVAVVGVVGGGRDVLDEHDAALGHRPPGARRAERHPERAQVVGGQPDPGGRNQHVGLRVGRPDHRHVGREQPGDGRGDLLEQRLDAGQVTRGRLELGQRGGARGGGGELDPDAGDLGGGVRSSSGVSGGGSGSGSVGGSGSGAALPVACLLAHALALSVSLDPRAQHGSPTRRGSAPAVPQGRRYPGQPTAGPPG
jgi:hypothetical protein